MPKFSWKQLLSTKRVRDLFDGAPSERVEGDKRTPFDQDYGRAVFSTPVRRLQDKAQVFPLEPNDSVRTRLTHSLEVSSIARGLGEAAEKFARTRGDGESIPVGSLSTIAATGALVHDIGNPPFGHAGERAISSWFEKHQQLFETFPGTDLKSKLATQYAQDFLSFEGNAQTQRLLSSLQMLADRHGLNMTCGTLSASLKYVVASDKRTKNRADAKKHGYFASENELIRLIKSEVGTGDARHPIAFLVEAADDIAYATVDLEDGIKKGCLDWDTLKDELRKGADGPLLQKILEDTRKKIEPANLSGRALSEAMSIAFRTYAIAQLVKAAIASFENSYEAIMDGTHSNSLLDEEPAKILVGACKGIGFKYVYSAPQILKLELMGKKVIWDLLDLYWDGAKHIESGKSMPSFAGKACNLISGNYRQVCTDHIQQSTSTGVPADYYRMQLITDQVCGMTDSFAVTLHRELTNG